LNNQAGYTGTGFADYQNASNDYVQWSATVPTAGNYTLTFRYSMGNTPRTLAISVNGTTVNGSLTFPRTTTWTTWTTISIPATLTAGTNLIRATAIGSSGPNLDQLVISNTAQASTIASNEDAFDRRGRCSFKVYPNPAKQELSIAPDIEDKESFEVTDGQLKQLPRKMVMQQLPSR
jgi:hypothetical protein